MLQSKTTVLKLNDENALPKCNVKAEIKSATEQYKFSVLNDENQSVTDENEPPSKYKDEVDHAVSNSSFSGIRYDLFILFQRFFFVTPFAFVFFSNVLSLARNKIATFYYTLSHNHSNTLIFVDYFFFFVFLLIMQTTITRNQTRH